MLSEFGIRNFKCFDDISLKFRPLTVLTGINGTGKSSFIQALLLLRQSGNPIMRELILNGPLVSLGYGQDVLYEFADDDSNIVFTAQEDGNQRQVFSFGYDKDARNLMRTGTYEEDSQTGSLWGNDFFYLKAERTGPRKSFPLFSEGSFNPIGSSGEYCASLLREHEDMNCPDLRLCSGYTETKLILQAEAWLSELGRPVRISLEPHRSTDSIGLGFSFKGAGGWSNSYRASNVGFGLTYVLPVFVSCLIAGKNGLVIVENPEAHLHPKGQVLLGEFLAQTANSGVQIIIETHSDHILNGIRIAVKKGKIQADDTVIHFFRPSSEGMHSSAESPKINSRGRIDLWPEGFFDELEKSLMKLL